MAKYNVEHWAKFTSPCYDTVVTMDHYHLVNDKGTAKFYIQENKPRELIAKKQHKIRQFNKQIKRKEIDTFCKVNDGRFEPIEKSP